MLEAIKTELENRGYVVNVTEVVKNSVTFTGLTVGKVDLKIVPTIYEDSRWESMSVSEIADEIDDILNNSSAPDIDVNKLTDPEYLKDNVYLCIQRKGSESILKDDYLDLEVYVRCKINDNASFKVPCSIGSDGLLEAAIENTRSTFLIREMSEFLSEMMGVPKEFLCGENFMWVVTNKSKCNAAACLYYPELFKRFCNDHNINGCWILPSSIHEVLVIPVDNGCKCELDQMVSEVNGTEVKPEERLSDHAYYYSLEDNRITY